MMDIAFIQECEEFYEAIGINRSEWAEYENAHEFASKFAPKEKEEVLISTSDHVRISENIIESLINA